jgi:hypothetical protein
MARARGQHHNIPDIERGYGMFISAYRAAKRCHQQLRPFAQK